MRRFKGFTLTELMVALAVIGILVAVVTPAIVKTRPNKNKMMVKKTFYTTEQIVSSLINDPILYPDMSEICRSGAPDDDDRYCAWGFDYVEGAESEGAIYEDEWKFAALFKDRLNVARNDQASRVANATPDNDAFFPVFYTIDGVKWDLRGTVDGNDPAWEAEMRKVGSFDDNCTGANDSCTSKDNDVPGAGTILVDVNGDEEPNVACTANNEDCDQYEIQILANGKLRIHPQHTRAIEWATINTSIRDSL